MYKKEDYLKLIMGGFTIGMLFLIVCIYSKGIGFDNGYEYANWLVDNNKTLSDNLDTSLFNEYKDDTRPSYIKDYNYYQRNAPNVAGRTLRSVKSDLYSSREPYYDEEYLKYLEEQEEKENEYYMTEDKNNRR